MDLEFGCAEIKHTHGENGAFAADVFQAVCAEKHQSYSFSGVDGHHQRGHSKLAIQTIIYIARTLCNMFHSIGLNMVLMIWHYIHLLSNMQLGYAIGCQIK